MAFVNRLVIGLDYGTTYTGVAFQAVKADGVTEEFNLVLTWPNRDNAEKVPSEISYTPSPLNKSQWGYDFENGSLKFSWTKLELDQQKKVEELDLILKALVGTNNLDFGVIEQARGLPSHPARDPEDIVADYLSFIRQHLWDNLLQVFSPVVLASIPVDLVITVPAMWTESARNKTFRSVCKGGFDKLYFSGLRPAIMITEPEATFYSLIKELRPRFGEVSLLPGESFVVCDAGGGTVDLVSYRIEQINPEFKWEMITAGTGYKCGATFIDLNFRKWLDRKLGRRKFEQLAERSAFDNIGSHTIVEPRMAKVMDEFRVIKERFEGVDRPSEEFIQLPYPLHDYSDPANGINGGEVRITVHDLKEMFRFSVDKTIELIAGQISQVREAGSRVRYVFLSGGFATSKYLYNEVDLFLRMQTIRLELAKHAWSAVVRGAVARGVELDENNLVRVRKCSRHYGVSVSQSFSHFKHSDTDAYIDPYDGQKKAKDQMIWLVKKGDGIFSDQRTHPSINLRRKYSRQGPQIFRATLVSCEEDIAPGRLADVPIATRQIATLNYSFEDVPGVQVENVRAFGRGGHSVANFKIELRFEEGLKFTVSCNGNELRSASVEYVA